jgi:multiple sugar transport system substrate-binding protein
MRMESMGGQLHLRRTLGLAAVVIAIAFMACCSGCSGKKESGPTLRFVTWKPNQPKAWAELYSLFAAEHPDIHLVRELGPHSSSAFHDLLTQKLKNKSTHVDAFLMDVTWPPEFGSAGWAMVLDDVLPESERKKFLPGAILADTYENHIYGVPLYVDSGVLYYRTDLLEKYGFNPPRTWEELVGQSRTIMAGEAAEGNSIQGFSGQFKQYEGLVCNMMEYILSNRGSIIDKKTGLSAFQRPPAVYAVNFVKNSIIGNIAP